MEQKPKRHKAKKNVTIVKNTEKICKADFWK